jgi:predicted transcriptional regulator
MIRLSKLEEDILNKLWMLEKAFPKVLISHLEKPIPPYNTVLSSIRKLEKLDFIGYTKYGKSHEYFPILKKEEYSKSLFKKLFHDLMDSSNEALLSYFMKEEKIDINELERLVKKMKNKSK